jgi:hypothetical protein
MVARWSKAWNVSSCPAGCAGRGFAKFALQGGDIAFLAGDAGLHLSDSVQVLLVVLLVAVAIGLAGVVFLLQCGQRVFFFLQLALQDAASVGIACLLLAGLDTGAFTAARGGYRCPGAWLD